METNLKFDEVDIGLIKSLYETANQTTSDLAKKIFECPTSRELLKQDSLVRSRLKRLMEKKIILCSNTTPRTYNANPEHVLVGEGTFQIKINKGRKMDIDFGQFLVVTNGEDTIYIHRLKGDQDIGVITS